ncbi:hypothetical protein [Amycolatopsis taiwanensis]|uniref:hypothetical protein n=1 Tax=Amycolatopsis taiwanensis TaxID=342230 RepID=UPI0004839CFA|nr:hypothetical protein [Amycolatopsis taiwanensis]
MVQLFTAATLTALSGRPVSDASSAAIHDWVVDLIIGEIGAVPDPVPAGVLAVALELGRTSVPTPGGGRSITIGPYTAAYSAADARGVTGLTRDQRYRLRRAVGMPMAFSVDTSRTEVSS